METVWLEKKRFGEPRVAIVFPNAYKIGISNLAIHTLYRITNRVALADLFFTDIQRGIKTGWRLNEFDLILLTLPYEFDLLPFLKKLKEWGIEPRKDKREIPIVAGGIFPSSNPAVLSPIFDVIAVGEAEVILPQLLRKFTPDKDELISKLKEEPWAYIGGVKEEAKRVLDWPHNKTESYSVLIDRRATFSKMFLLEAGRGCPNKCRFCLLSYISLPPRYVDLMDFIPIIEGIGFEVPVGIVGSAILEHPGLIEFLDALPSNVTRVGLSSMRIELTTKEILKKLKKLKLKTITVAPEAGSYELRKKINKPISDEEILRLAEDAQEVGMGGMRLYFMVGLPHETLEDVEAIPELLLKIREKFKGDVSATVSIFVPKPHTPFEDEPFIDEKSFKERFKLLKKSKVKIRVHGYRESEWQAVISRGDERLGEAIIESAKRNIPLSRIMRTLGIDRERYLKDRSYFSKAPYKKVDSLVNPGFLKLEREKAESERTTPPCPPQKCNLCGVCGKVFHLETEGYKIG